MIKRAESAGFCHGVKNSIEKATQEPIGKRCVIGSLVHNKTVVERLRKKGLSFCDKPDFSFNEFVVSAHGICKRMAEEISPFKVIDATCVRVKRLIDIAKNIGENECLVLVGDGEHSEVKNVLSYAKNYILANKKGVEKELFSLLSKTHYGRYILAFQTTVSKSVFYEYEKSFNLFCDKPFEVCNTICPSVQKRIDESLLLAKECDSMIVLGDRHSANCTLLFEECKRINPNTIFISSKSELPEIKFDRVGVTGGASTDGNDIDEIVKIIENNRK